jgi:hypothetical protein
MTNGQPQPIARQTHGPESAPETPGERFSAAPDPAAAPDIAQAVIASQLPSSSKLTMLTLAALGDVVQIGLESLVKLTGLTKPTVRVHLSALENDGWLLIDRPSAEDSARRIPPIYRLAVPAEIFHTGQMACPVNVFTGQAIIPVTGEMTYPVKAFTGQVISPPRGSARAHCLSENLDIYTSVSSSLSVSEANGNARGVIDEAAAPLPLPSVAEIELRTVPSKPTRKATPNDSMEFDRFWKGYPRKIGKGAARQAWAKHVIAARIDVELVISAAEFFGLTRAGQDPKYTPHASTWLSQQRWEDTPDPEYRELNKAEQRTAHNLSLVVAAAEREGTNPLSLLFPDEAEQARLKAEADAWYRGEPLPPRPVAPSAPQEARRGGSPALEGAEWGQGRGRLF